MNEADLFMIYAPIPWRVLPTQNYVGLVPFCPWLACKYTIKANKKVQGIAFIVRESLTLQTLYKTVTDTQARLKQADEKKAIY